MGSFPVSGFDAACRAEYLRAKLDLLRPGSTTGCAPNYDRSSSVLLIVSLAGIKVCSPDGKRVQMAHALRRISYATCEPRIGQFSFLAREPRAHFSLQYCHSFITESPEQAEELNNIVGNAFRMAYVAQLQRQPAAIIQDVINQKSGSTSQYRAKDSQDSVLDVLTKSLDASSENNNDRGSCDNNNHHQEVVLVGGGSSRSPTPPASVASVCWKSSSSDCTSSSSSAADMNLHLGSQTSSPTLRLSKAPSSIPGLRSAHGFGGANVLGSPLDQKSLSQQSTPSSEESNSPTELNSYKRLADKPPLIKRLTMGLTGGRDVLGMNPGEEEDSCPLVSSDSSPTSPTARTTTTMMARPSSGGYINEGIIESESHQQNNSSSPHHYCYGKLLPGGSAVVLGAESESLDNSINSAKNFNIENNRLAEGDYRTATKRRSEQQQQAAAPPPPPPLPERHDSLNKHEESELRRAPWFQAGIPREITLEVLSQEPEGAFMVRESTSKPGCYALSLRVPRDFQPSGIAHYLIMRTGKGYKIKGFTKEFTTLTSLITHHSVMPELLPCPLSLSRYNPSFVKSDSRRDFADVDSDPDYNTLADFRKMMADLNV